MYRIIFGAVLGATILLTPNFSKAREPYDSIAKRYYESPESRIHLKSMEELADYIKKLYPVIPGKSDEEPATTHRPNHPKVKNLTCSRGRVGCTMLYGSGPK